MELVIRVPAGEKLVEYFLSGVADPMLAVWRAKRLAKAREVEAASHIDTADVLRSYGIFPQELDASFEYDITIGQNIEQRLKLQEDKRQRNIGLVAYRAFELLSDVGEVPDEEPDHDWTARFFNEVQDVSSEEMQELWAKVLAGEVERPGSTSIKTLDVLKNLDQNTAELFTRFACMSISLVGDGKFLDSRVPLLGPKISGNPLKDFNILYADLMMLAEYGLIVPEFNTVINDFVERSDGRGQSYSFHYQGCHWFLVVKPDSSITGNFTLHGIAMTGAGRELALVSDIIPVPEYDKALRSYFDSQGFDMIFNGLPT